MFNESLLVMMGPALCAGFLIILTHVPLGQEVLKRDIIFIDLAIAQIAALGVIAVNLLAGHDASPILTNAVAFIFALSAAWCFNKTEKYFSLLQEGLIGASFVVASSVAMLMLANSPHGSEHIESMLAGQILWINWSQIGVAALIYSAVLGIWFFTKKPERWFYYLFAATVTVSVQLVGVYLVFASLILPALATAQIKKGKRLRQGYVISLTALVAGMLISIAADLPTGPVLVCSMALTAMIFAMGKRLLRG